MFLGEIKKKASGFVQEKYKTARLALTDVTEAELLAEEATNNDSLSPDARTMTKIAESSFDIDDYWRIVDVLHKRLYSINWNQWRQSYKSLILLDFLLTHGPEDFAEEFQCDIDVIEELGYFKHADEHGFDWGANMRKRSERIMKLLKGGEPLKEARLKALKITKEIQGFGNLTVSPASSSTSATSASSRTSFGSYSTSSSIFSWNHEHNHELINKQDHDVNIGHNKDFSSQNYSHGGIPSEKPSLTFCSANDPNIEGTTHLWDSPIHETGSLLDDEEEERMFNTLRGGHSSRWDNGRMSFIRSFSDVGKEIKKRFDRQFSTRY